MTRLRLWLLTNMLLNNKVSDKSLSHKKSYFKSKKKKKKKKKEEKKKIVRYKTFNFFLVYV